MSEINNPELGGAPGGAPERRGLSPLRTDEDVSRWEAYGVNNVLDKLQLNKRYVTIPDDDLTGFLTVRQGFQFKPVLPEDQEDLNSYFRILDQCMDFSVMDSVHREQNVIYQYGGYDLELSKAKSPDELKAVFAQLDRCFLNLEEVAKEEKLGLDRLKGHLLKYIHFAMDFIGEATKILVTPTEWQERAFEDLFRVFCRLAAIQLQHAAREAPRHFEVFGTTVSGKPDLRAYVPVENENWWRQKPVTSSHIMPMKQALAAIVKVKLSPSNEAEGIEQETEKFLGEVVGEMLAELLSSDPACHVVKCNQMLGILVISTKVYFVKLHVPRSLMALYRKSSASCCQDKNIEKGTVYVTQGFDFMKRKTRLEVLKILHKIGTLTPVF